MPGTQQDFPVAVIPAVRPSAEAMSRGASRRDAASPAGEVSSGVAPAGIRLGEGAGPAPAPDEVLSEVAAFQPTRLRDRGTPVLDLLPPEEFAAGQRASLDLIRELNLRHRQARPGFTELDARIAAYELSYRMQSAALEVGDFEKESESLRRSYGLEHKDERTQAFGRKCLLARRLVERGVRFVQVYDMPDKDGWDAHAKLTDNHTPRARWTDQPCAALLADLKQRGLLDETLVIWASEFGRTPMMQDDLAASTTRRASPSGSPAAA